MKPFRYQLQKILELKEKEKEQAEWAFGKTMQKKNEEEAKLYRLTERREELTHFLYAVQTECCSAAQLIDLTRYRQAVDKAIETQLHTLHGCEEEVERAKLRLTHKMQESQLWSRHRERAKEMYDEEAKKREQKELDEIGISRYLRRSN